MPRGLRVGGVLFEEPVYGARTCQIPLARRDLCPPTHTLLLSMFSSADTKVERMNQDPLPHLQSHIPDVGPFSFSFLLAG